MSLRLILKGVQGDGQRWNLIEIKMTTPSGVPVTGEAAIHLSIACGNDPSTVRPFVGFGIINRLEAAASSTYHALQASLRRDVGGLQFSVAYTYSHAIDDLSARGDGNFVDSYNFRSNRASGGYDQRHILNINTSTTCRFSREQEQCRNSWVAGSFQVLLRSRRGLPSV
jgi:hypothetical protein